VKDGGGGLRICVCVPIETIDKIGSIEIDISEDNEDLLKYLIMS
jgi:hypothetical protein